MDSDGVPQSGIFSGHIHWLGSHEQCLDVKATGNDIEIPGLGSMTHDFDAKYCRSYFSYFGRGPVASVGVCLPEHCTREDVTHILRVGNGSLPVFYTYCGEKREFSDDPGAIVTSTILGIFAFVVIAATIVDYVLRHLSKRTNKTENLEVNPEPLETNSFATNGDSSDDVGNVSTINVQDETAIKINPDQLPVKLNGCVEGDAVVGETKVSSSFKLAEDWVQPKEKKHGKPLRVLLAFSLRRNVPRVLSTRMSPGAYLAFNGIRFFSMAWIVLGHTWEFGISLVPYPVDVLFPLYSAENTYSYRDLKSRWTQMAVGRNSLAVDTFLLLSSCLVTTAFMKQLDKQKGRPTVRQMALHYIHRYWRLTPVFAVVILIYTTLVYHWNTGPMAIESSMEWEFCKDNWWANLLYIHNLYKPNQICMGWTWYLAIDFQYYIIAPLFAFLIYKFTIPGAVFLFLGYCGSLAARIVLYREDDLVRFVDIYIKPWARFGPYAIGMAVGYVLYRTKCKVKIPMIGVVIGWTVAIASCLAAVYGSYNRGDCDGCSAWSDDLKALYYATYRDLFSLGIAWLMFACSTGYGGIANTFLSWKGFVSVSRLTYVGYHIHPVIICYYYYSVQRATYIEDLTMAMMYCAFLSTTLAAAFVLTLLFEVPMLQLENVLLPARKKAD